MEKSVAHCVMPQSGNFAIQANALFQYSLNLHFLFGASRFFTGGSVIAYPETVENSARNHPENAGDYLIGIHHPRHAARPCIHRSPTENSAPDVWALRVGILGSVDRNRYPYPNPNHNPNSSLSHWSIIEQWSVGVRILSRSLFEFRHFVALRGKNVA